MSTGGRSNGFVDWEIGRGPLYTKRRAELEPLHPRLRHVLEGVEWELQRNPTQYARNLGEGGPTWVVESARGIAGAPVVWVYFTLDRQRHRCLIQSFEIVEHWEDGPSLYDAFP